MEITLQGSPVSKRRLLSKTLNKNTLVFSFLHCCYWFLRKSFHSDSVTWKHCILGWTGLHKCPEATSHIHLERSCHEIPIYLSPWCSAGFHCKRHLTVHRGKSDVLLSWFSSCHEQSHGASKTRAVSKCSFIKGTLASLFSCYHRWKLFR